MSDNGPKITIDAFRGESLELLAQWLRDPAVRKTWGDPAEPLELATDLPGRYEHAIIADEGAPVGYLLWARCDAGLLESVGCGDLPAGTVDIDILLGAEAVRGQGVGPAALERLAGRLFEEGAPLLSLISSRENHRAHRAFQKAGWRRDRPFEDKTFGPCWLFLRWAPQ